MTDRTALTRFCTSKAPTLPFGIHELCDHKSGDSASAPRCIPCHKSCRRQQWASSPRMPRRPDGRQPRPAEMPIGKLFRTARGLMFAASTSPLSTELMYVAGTSRYRSCLCYVQPHDPRFRSLYSQTCRRRERLLTMDAKTDPSTRWPRPCLGCLLHHTLWLCQLAEAYQTGQAGQYRNSTVQPCRQLVQKVLPTLPPSRRSYNHQLVYLSVWCI